MKISVIINNYNYGRFIGDAISSVLEQTYRDLELIIVDDGSTDDSHSVIQQFSDSDSRVKAIYKDNGGQMSAFNAGMKNVSGDIVCFLDSDDMYKPDYLSVLADLYSSTTDCDFVICATQEFSGGDAIATPFGIKGTTDLGYTALLTLTSSFWVGDRTSSLSMRANKAKNIFPLPFENDWYLYADMVLADIASIAMFRVLSIDKPLVNYRIHPDSCCGKRTISGYGYLYKMREYMAKSFAQQRYYNIDFHLTRDFLPKNLEREARTGQKPEMLLEAYSKAIKYCNAPWLCRLKYSRRVLRLIKEGSN